jgi:hypothetical protein
MLDEIEERINDEMCHLLQSVLLYFHLCNPWYGFCFSPCLSGGF